MTPLEQTLITLIVAYGTYSWGRRSGISDGVKATIETLRVGGAIDEETASKFMRYDDE